MAQDTHTLQMVGSLLGWLKVMKPTNEWSQLEEGKTHREPRAVRNARRQLEWVSQLRDGHSALLLNEVSPR
tara:strand:+ start:65 stop:277 length:213 start_codon:yes stop_codon:yes gene_type:complete